MTASQLLLDQTIQTGTVGTSSGDEHQTARPLADFKPLRWMSSRRRSQLRRFDWKAAPSLRDVDTSL